MLHAVHVWTEQLAVHQENGAQRLFLSCVYGVFEDYFLSHAVVLGI